MKPLTVYTAASFRLLHAVRLFHDALRARIPDVQILDWTDKATPPPELTPEQRRQWFDTEQQGGQVYEFCADACRHADVVVYLGASGQDAGVEVGLAAGNGTPVLGVIKPEHNAFLDEVRAQSGVELFPLTIENREEAPAAIAAWYARASREKRV